MGRLSRIKRRVQRVAYSRGADRGGPDDAVLLASSARSGSTWVQELIDHRNDYRLVFEPFRPDKVPAVRHFHDRQYLRPDTLDPAYVEPAAKILAGEVRHPWIDAHNRTLVAERRLIKEVRGNLMLPWLHARFPRLPIVFLMRHPCAVVASRMRLGWNNALPGLLAQEDLVEDFLRPHVDRLRGATDAFDQHLLHWCVEALVPLTLLAPGDAHVVFYEGLCTDPDAEIRRLFAFLGDEDVEHAVARSGRQSAMTRDGAAIRDGGDLVRSWMKHVDEAQRSRAVELLAAFGLDAVYGAEPLPRVEADAVLRVL